MKRIVTPAKVCCGCKAVLLRARWADGRLEAPTRFARRVYCGNRCKGLGYENKRRSVKRCRHCAAWLHRKRYPSGREPKSSFGKRRFCDVSCLRLWRDDQIRGAAA